MASTAGVFTFESVSRRVDPTITIGVSQRLRSIEPAGCNELVSINDIANIPRNTAIGGNRPFFPLFAESRRRVKSDDISPKKLDTILNQFAKTTPFRRHFFCWVS